MKFSNPRSPLIIVALFLLCNIVFHNSPPVNSQEISGTITINKNEMTNKTTGGKVLPGQRGYANTSGLVEFKGDAVCSCDVPSLQFKWHAYSASDPHGDLGKNVNYSYGTDGGGDRTPCLEVECYHCGAHTFAPPLTVSAISGIKVTKIGDISNPTNNGRLCFDTYRDVEAEALPSGVQGSDKIDWYLVLHSDVVCFEINDPTKQLAIPVDETFGWPRSNSDWGENTLYASIGKKHTLATNSFWQEGELNLTGKDYPIVSPKSVKVFYDALDVQNGSTDSVDGSTPPNWFYYYKNNAGGGEYRYSSTRTTSWAYPSGGMSRVEIADNAHSGGQYLVTDHSNPGDRLKALSWYPNESLNKYYAHFMGVLAHEGQHATYDVEELSWDWFFNDADADHAKNSFESDVAHTHPSFPESARGFLPASSGWEDNEVYAGGPIEEPAFSTANTSQDWARPGTNWPGP